jgi:hypothetical protein
MPRAALAGPAPDGGTITTEVTVRETDIYGQ